MSHEVRTVAKCPNCGGQASLRDHCGADHCTWKRCQYCFAVTNGEVFYIDQARR